MRQSGRFFCRRWTNCSPRAVVACVALARAIQGLWAEHTRIQPTASGVDALAGAVREQGDGTWSRTVCHAMAGANMASFAALYTDGNTDKDDLQIGLYVQAMLYHKSSQRRMWLPSMRNPIAIAQLGAARVRQHFYTRCDIGWRLDVGRGRKCSCVPNLSFFRSSEPLRFWCRHITDCFSQSWTGSGSSGRSEAFSHVVNLLPRSRAC